MDASKRCCMSSIYASMDLSQLLEPMLLMAADALAMVVQVSGLLRVLCTYYWKVLMEQ